jgi:hypothetical protein
MQATEEHLDFDEEAHKLFALLNLAPQAERSKYNHLDPIWRNEETGAQVFCGNRVSSIFQQAYCIFLSSDLGFFSKLHRAQKSWLSTAFSP